MAAKAVLVLCAQTLLIQCISSQCIGAGYPGLAAPYPAAPYAPYAAPLATPCATWGITPVAELVASNGPGLAVTSASPIPPIGISVASENAIEGPLAIGGAVPFLGTVGVEGALPTAGAGAIAYNCGNGAVGITAEDIATAYSNAGPLTAAPLGLAAPLAAPLGLAAPFAAPLGALEAPFGGCGCGYRGYY